ncbi:MAG: UPF0104 family protein [Candidatus Omnitrophota bacterium]|jgi:uncharacterized protein (TIRG00374 family)|nr:MAG: UPF0104 family protein [Candidatus Omnitrophota bacterium]
MKSILFRLIGVAVFFLLLYMFWDDLRELGQLQSVNPWLFLAVVPFHFGQWLLRALRWQIILRNESITISLHENFVVSVAGFFIGCPTPGRLGEFIKVKFLMNAGFSFRGAFMASLMERLLDIATLMVFVLLGLAIAYSLMPDSIVFYLAFAIFVLAIVIALYRNRVKCKTILARMIPESIAADLQQKLGVFTQSFRGLTKKQWSWITVESLLIWGLNYWMIYLLFRAAGFTISLPYAFAFAAFGSLAGLMPITIYGLGIREAVLIALFRLAGYPQETGLIFGLMFMVLMLYHIILGFLGWMSPWMRRFQKRKS